MGKADYRKQHKAERSGRKRKLDDRRGRRNRRDKTNPTLTAPMRPLPPGPFDSCEADFDVVMGGDYDLRFSGGNLSPADPGQAY